MTSSKRAFAILTSSLFPFISEVSMNFGQLTHNTAQGYTKVPQWRGITGSYCLSINAFS